jgi:hypothetical protein
MKMPVSVHCDLCSWQFYADVDLVENLALIALFRQQWEEHQRRVHPAIAEERIARARINDDAP